MRAWFSPIPVVLILLLGACGRFDDPPLAASGAAAASEAEAASPVAQPSPTFAPTPELLPFPGEPPVWGLDRGQTIDIVREFFMGDPVARFGLPDSCSKRSHSWMECEGAVWSERGISAGALELKRDFHISVFAAEGSGPVWVAWVYDWMDYESNGYSENLIFTPAGILTHRGLGSWQVYQDAVAVAKASEMYTEINDAIEAAGGDGYPYSYGQARGEDVFIGAPIATMDGWTVPLTMGLTDCHACQSEFAGRFAIDFTSDGTPSGVRFLDHCYYVDDGGGSSANDAVILAVKAQLPICEPHTPHDGSVSPFQRFTMEPTG